jgi:hypothetical protein
MLNCIMPLEAVVCPAWFSIPCTSREELDEASKITWLEVRRSLAGADPGRPPDLHGQDATGAQQLARVVDRENRGYRAAPLPVVPDDIHAPRNIHAFHATILS